MEFDFLRDILLSGNSSEMIRSNEDEIFKIIPELSKCKNFKQNNIWHIYDVYEHILHVIDGVPRSIDLRLAALFHDIGKPYVYTEDEIFKIIPELSKCKNFKQNNIWHIYDVYEHILHVIDGVPRSIDLRLAALFHDIGKPYVYTEDENGIGHFYNHWNKSKEIFDSFSQKYSLENDIRILISNLILYHDLNIGKIDDSKLNKLATIFGENGIIKLFQLKRSDLLAQNEQFHYMLDDYDIQKERMLLIKRKL